MTVYFVSRHDGAQHWARILQKQGNWPYSIDAYVEHLDVQALCKGDVVIGTLPLREATEVRRRGAEYLSLDLQVPPHWRGQELTATQMTACGATLTSYRITVKETFDVHAVRKVPKSAKSTPAVTVMLVSQELMPQFLGFVHAPTPHVMLVVTSRMSDRGDALQALLKVAPEPPEKVQRLRLKDDEGYASFLQQAEALLKKLLGDGAQSITLNLTGGTKLMSMAFAEAGQAAVRLEYVDTQHGRIERILGRQSQAMPMRALLGVREAVLASGKPDAGCASASALFQQQMQRTPLHDFLLDVNAMLIGVLNRLCMEMEQLLQTKKPPASQKTPTTLANDADAAKSLIFTLPPGRDFVVRPEGRKAEPLSLRHFLANQLGKLLHQQGVLVDVPLEQQGSLILQLARPSEIDYLKGGWLEAHVASIIEAAKPDDWACGVQVGKDVGKNNEIDAIVTCGNRTLLVEVKTASLIRESGEGDGEKSTKGQDTIYKLDSVGHDLARNFNTNWLISARNLSPVDESRANDKGIKVFCSKGNSSSARAAIEAFEKELRDWISKSRSRAAVSTEHRFSALAVSSDWLKKEKKDGVAAPGLAVQRATQPTKKETTRGGLSNEALSALAAFKANRKGTEQA